MALPRWWAHATRSVGLNRIVRRISWWAPGLAVIIHRGARRKRGLPRSRL
jgi:hypothetical protein